MGQTGMQLALPQQADLSAWSTELRPCGVERSLKRVPASARAKAWSRKVCRIAGIGYSVLRGEPSVSPEFPATPISRSAWP
jgi:hypothetical protein